MKDDGFTVIELLVVLVIIAILLVAVTPVAVNAIKKAKKVNIALMMRNVSEALEDFFYSDGSKMSDSSETNLSWINVTYLHDNDYLQLVIDDIVIEWKDGNISDGTATARIEYNKGDFDVDSLRKFWDEIDDDDDDGNADILKKLVKYW